MRGLGDSVEGVEYLVIHANDAETPAERRGEDQRLVATVTKTTSLTSEFENASSNASSNAANNASNYESLKLKKHKVRLRKFPQYTFHQN